MRHTLVTLGLLASLAGAPGFVGLAAAHPSDTHHQVHRVAYHGYDRAWRIVRNDPCRFAHYRRFAAQHANPVKRRHMVERLAYEGCRSPHVRHR